MKEHAERKNKITRMTGYDVEKEGEIRILNKSEPNMIMVMNIENTIPKGKGGNLVTFSKT